MDLARTSHLLRNLAEIDPTWARFGAATHRYTLHPRLTTARIEQIERDAGILLPDDYRRFVMEMGDGGAGPGYGLLPLDHPAQRDHLASPFPFEKPLLPGQHEEAYYFDDARLDGTVVLSDHGCGYFSVLVVHPGSPAYGKVWVDVRGAGVGLVPARPSFTAWYDAWLAEAAHDPPLTDCPAPASRCAPPSALANYLANFEQKEGVAAGELPAERVRSALLGIGDGGLATRTTQGRCFDENDPVRPCPCCRAMVDRFIARGMMREAQLLPGLPPKQARAA